MSQIQTLEAKSDPKCYATASRLQDFMFGTPLSCHARFANNELLKSLAKSIWQSIHASNPEDSLIEEAISKRALPRIQPSLEGSCVIELADGERIELSGRDRRQYSSIAYSLRAILAVKQEQLLFGGEKLTHLSEPMVAGLKSVVDDYSLAALQKADQLARERNSNEISEQILREAWLELGLVATPEDQAEKELSQGGEHILPQVIAQKLASYQAYNAVNNQLFVRNLQVYFAKARWPSDSAEAKQLRSYYTQAMVQFAGDLYLLAQQLAERDGEELISESSMHRALQSFTPFEVNEFEDVSFFPKLADKSIEIEAYDMDAFRDSGLHWLYLKYVLSDYEKQILLDVSPFAAELLAEGVAQFGVLLWRQAGEKSKQAGDEYLSSDRLGEALQYLQSLIQEHAMMGSPAERPELTLHSSQGAKAKPASEGVYFKEVTDLVGIAMQHRSSDWLSRQLRSYINKGNGVGEITIPPAFGGSGIAAEDVDGDGWPDLLVLSGAGNKLYQNLQDGTFKEVTQQAGIDWKREDGTYGEVRQPIFVDFDNDGDQDLFISYVNDSHRIYRNDGSGKFEDLSQLAQLGGEGQVAGPCTVLDYDKDGLLDIYIGYFGNYLSGDLPTLARHNRNGGENQLFRNLGGFQFENVTQSVGVGDCGWTQAVGHSDIDGDGWQDLISGNDFGSNVYYRNLGIKDGRHLGFVDVTEQLGTGKASYTMGIGIADLNADELPDFYISNIVTMNKDQKYVLPNEGTTASFNPEKLANMRVVEANDLFLSTRSAGAGLPKLTNSLLVDRGYASTGWSWDADFFDFDHDGDDDLYVLNGMNDFNIYAEENPFYAEPLRGEKKEVTFAHGRSEQNVFFVNDGGRLQQGTDASGLGIIGNSRSAVYFDYDGDGDLDVAVNPYHGEVSLWRNDMGAKLGSSASIKLVDRHGGDAIGATAIMKFSDGSQVWREVHSTTGYLSAHPKALHFGMGGHERGLLQVTWPDGTSSEYQIPAGSKLMNIQQTPQKEQ
ncbi:CRTAC1 family protein [Persicirhabdus sediminis]|uniref:CRTAC1 family protein n=1 Tax=Persicirhabdus sediminis TaxID=454144 RepID=A0A8J7MB59_9BACT|nr:CRTAC1 family protein [Persicirhabdus sediminis]MBK1790299.1 CRTAC1 family protein [Persicirhabdus sediminis]